MRENVTYAAGRYHVLYESPFLRLCRLDTNVKTNENFYTELLKKTVRAYGVDRDELKELANKFASIEEKDNLENVSIFSSVFMGKKRIEVKTNGVGQSYIYLNDDRKTGETQDEIPLVISIEDSNRYSQRSQDTALRIGKSLDGKNLEKSKIDFQKITLFLKPEQNSADIEIETERNIQVISILNTAKYKEIAESVMGELLHGQL